ncbi:hypothetical protein ACHAWX_002736 [Stephanocyclus meneghinianus]
MWACLVVIVVILMDSTQANVSGIHENTFLSFSVLGALLVAKVVESGDPKHCSSEDTEAASKRSDKKDPPIINFLAKWIGDWSTEGQAFLQNLLNTDGTSQDADRVSDDGTESKSFFDEMKDAFSSFKNDQENKKMKNSFVDMMDFFQSIIALSIGDDRNARELAEDFIQKAAEVSAYHQSNKSTPNLLEFSKLMIDAFGKVAESIHRNFGHIDWHKLRPFDFMYFLEYVESMRTPSWKRRLHGLAPAVSVNEVKELHKALYLANLAYGDTAEGIKSGLLNSDWELIHAQLTNAPGEPAHYIALRKNRLNSIRSYLDVLLVVRGTKDFKDVLSDGLLDAVDFRGGKAHAGLAISGKFLVDHHRDLLRELMKMANKTNIKLTLIGHSLGAGAAAIAGIIFNEEEPNVEANVIGFGCPALLSNDLSIAASKYVTTIVSDSDMIPRMSGPSVENAILDLMSYDWIERGLEDLQNIFENIRVNLPFDIPPESIEKVYGFVQKFLENTIKPQMDEMSKKQRRDVVLIPPGNCIHFYRDGTGITGQTVPCNLFDNLEISRTMIDDHMIPTGYNRMLLDFMRYYLADYQFVFDQMIVT